MKQVYSEIILSIILFVVSIFLIFMPPVKLFFTILGVIGMIVALSLLITNILLGGLR